MWSVIWPVMTPGQRSPGRMLPGKMSLWKLAIVHDDPRKLPLKFGQNLVSNSWDNVDIEFVWWWVCSVQSHFRVFNWLGFDNLFYFDSHLIPWSWTLVYIDILNWNLVIFVKIFAPKFFLSQIFMNHFYWSLMCFRPKPFGDPEGHFPPKVVFYQRSSFIASKVGRHQSLFFIIGHLPS